MKKKRIFTPFKSLFLIGLLLFFSFLIGWKWGISPADANSQQSQIFVIPQGQSIDTIAKRLKGSGLIRSRAVFKVYVVKNQLVSKIQAGDFRLRPSMDVAEIAQELTHGTLDIWVTLLEGWRREEIADKLEQEFVGRNADFDRQAFLQVTSGKEGYLFPDTYLIPRNASAEGIANTLLSTFDQKVDFSVNKSGLSDKQVVILASIIEREVATEGDRTIVAGILLKRLENNWALQTDATIQYFVGTRLCQSSVKECNWWKQNLTKADIEAQSPYNTYLNQGLPPTPISNPSLASINSVLQPTPSDHWFYISDSRGKIHYADSIEAHNANIAKYLTSLTNPL